MRFYTKKSVAIYLSEVAVNKIRAMVEASRNEVGAVGTVKKLEDGQFLIEDIFIPKQKAHGTTCELDPDSLIQIAVGLEDPNSIRCWIHSHVDMPVVPSTQDEKQLDELSKDCDFFIAGIHNTNDEVRYCLVEGDCIYDDVPVTIMNSGERARLLLAVTKAKLELEKYDEEQRDEYEETIRALVDENVERMEYENKKYSSRLAYLQYKDNIERSLYEEGVYDQGLYYYFGEMLTLDEIFTIEELAGMALCNNVDELRKKIEKEYRVLHEWNDEDLENILIEVSQYALDDYEEN